MLKEYPPKSKNNFRKITLKNTAIYQYDLNILGGEEWTAITQMTEYANRSA